MTRRFLHNDPWSSLLDAWSEAYPRLRHTISVRDDRLPSKQARATRATNSAVASAACLEGPRGPFSHFRGERFAKLGRIAPRDRGGLSTNFVVIPAKAGSSIPEAAENKSRGRGVLD